MAQFSIITVCRNAESEIEQTMDSVFAQENKDYEYIIVDGASKDGTLGIIKESIKQHNAEEKVVLVSENDNGIYDAMNKGIGLAKNEWVVFLNAGDSFYDPSVLMLASKYLDQTTAGIVYGDTNYSENGVCYVIKGKEIRTISKQMPFCHQSVFNRKSVIESHMYDTNYSICADYDLYCRLYYDGVSFEHWSAIICNYVTGGESQKHQRQMIKEILEIRKKNYNLRFFTPAYCKKILRMYLGKAVKIIVPIEILRRESSRK